MKKGIDLAHGKVELIRHYWMTTSRILPGVTSDSEFKTRSKARGDMKLRKASEWFPNVHMYKVTEVVFGDGTIFTTKKKAR